MKRDAVIKRLQKARTRAAGRPTREIKRLISKMTTEELKEIAYGDISPERLREIWERVKSE